MVATEFLDFIRKIKSGHPRPEDLSDRLNFLWTPVLLMVCMILVLGKQYVLKPIACFFNDAPTQLQATFLTYAENYCWISGTYAFYEGKEGCKEGTSSECDKYWQSQEHKKLIYYQWVPFVLGIQFIVAYLPKMFWRQACGRRLGADVYALVEVAATAKACDADTFRKTSARVADALERMLVHNREYRTGTLQRLRDSISKWCNLLVVSRQRGTVLTVLYILVKLMCLVNTVGQLWFMEYFLGYRGARFTLGLTMAKQAFNNTLWQETHYFPLLTMCRVKTFEFGARHTFRGQCTLSVNMLNDKVYAFLYFWFLIVACVTVLSCARWLYRLLSFRRGERFVKLCLRVGSQKFNKSQVHEFIGVFLRRDGLFLVLMLSEGSDKVIASEVVRLLFLRWAERQEKRDEMRPMLGMSDGLKPSKGKGASAPFDDSGMCV